MMRQLMMKELSEHLRWAALAGIAFLAVLGIVQGAMTLPTSVNDRQLVGDVALGGMAWGVVLGLLQNLRDGRSVWFGLLMHRPVSIAMIVRAKLTSGLILYAIAIFVPVILICCWLSRTVPNRPPFVIESVMPIAVSSLIGVLGYFAASHVAIRHARWWASRTLPFAIAFCGLFCVEASNLLAALLGLLGIAVLLLSLVYGWFTAQGRDELVHWWPRCCWSICMLVPLGMLVAILAESGYRRAVDYQYASYVLDSAGTPIIQHQVGALIRYTDLNQQPLPHEPVLYPKVMGWVDGRHQAPAEAQPWWNSKFFSQWNNASHYGIAMDRDHDVDFYWMDTSCQIMACSSTTGSILGYVDTAGVVAHPASNWQTLSNPYSGPGSQVFIHQGAVYAFNQVAGRLDLQLRLAAGETITGAFLMASSTEHQYWIATSRRLVLLTQTGSLVESCPLPEFDSRAVVAIVSTGTDQRTVMLYTPYASNAHDSVRPPELVVYDATGHPAPARILPVIINPTLHTPAMPVWENILSPPAILLNFPPSFRECVVTLLAVLGACAVLIVWSRRWRLEVSAAVCWSLAIVAVGPLALVPWLSLRQGPPRERCPQCRRLRVITHERCEHCQCEFARPGVLAIDIIDAQPWSAATELALEA